MYIFSIVISYKKKEILCEQNSSTAFWSQIREETIVIPSLLVKFRKFPVCKSWISWRHELMESAFLNFFFWGWVWCFIRRLLSYDNNLSSLLEWAPWLHYRTLTTHVGLASRDDHRVGQWHFHNNIVTQDNGTARHVGWRGASWLGLCAAPPLIW
jgi:hypothetical protein